MPGSQRRFRYRKQWTASHHLELATARVQRLNVLQITDYLPEFQLRVEVETAQMA